MASKILQQFHGHSGSEIYLLRKVDRVFVRKINNVDRNHDRLLALQNYSVPKVYGRHANTLDMEYIHGLDMRTYLINHSAAELADFLLSILKSFAKDSKNKNYSPTYKDFLSEIDFQTLPFSQTEFIAKLPAELPSSQYHGDLTLENIIWTSHGFYMIDCSTGPWNSWMFDLAKLQQDLECHWFLRKNPAMLETKLAYIQNKLTTELDLQLDNNLIILMLLRVLKHCQPDDADAMFIKSEITRLWKL